MSVHQLPHGQYRHVINLPQRIASFLSSLPQLPSVLDVTVVRRRRGIEKMFGLGGGGRHMVIYRKAVYKLLSSILIHVLYIIMLSNLTLTRRIRDKNAKPNVNTREEALDC